jgi:two-component sensor histidine kinase
VDHRAKNVLAVVQAALRMTPKSDPEVYAKAVEGRVMAIARAHTLLAEEHWTGAELRALLKAELAAFLSAAPSEPLGCAMQAKLCGPDVRLTPIAAQALSMVLHELATNATKHGALSVAGGRVVVSWRVVETERTLRLRWAETGGPPVSGTPTCRGFGSRVIEATIKGQLGGTLRQDWEPSGLVCEITMPLIRTSTAAEA